jgi:voltage-gated potassium channel
MVSKHGRLSRATRQNRRLALKEIVRLLGIAAGLFALYYVLPLGRLNVVPLGLSLAIGVIVLGAVSVWQIKAVIDAEHPPVRAVEALAGVIPLFLILFASAYYVVAGADPTAFSDPLTRTDALYFTLTILSTVGFGDIVATSQVARATVMFQMMLNLILLGLGVQVLTQAVHIGVAQHPPNGPTPGGD